MDLSVNQIYHNHLYLTPSWPTFLFFSSFLQVAQEIWVCENQTITKWNRDILAYKEHLKSKIEKQAHDI